jgi:hypothetical protein
MGTLGLEGVIRAWELEQLTTEQTIGQILLLLRDLEERIRDIERKYWQLSKKLPDQQPGAQSPERDKVE